MGFGEEVHGAENRQAWMLVGMAIRCAYGLGIDKVSNFRPDRNVKDNGIDENLFSWLCDCLMRRNVRRSWNERDWLGLVSGVHQGDV